MAIMYRKFPNKGHNDENISADRNEDLVYQKEYKNAAKIAAKEEAPISVDPKAPSVPKFTA